MKLVIDEKTSCLITSINTICMILIVFMHSVVQTDHEIVRIVNNFIYGTITRIAVPLFFLVSSILFFRDFTQYTRDVYVHKITRRVQTLLIPYFIALFLYILFFYITQQFPQLRTLYKSEQIIENFSAKDLLMGVFVFPFNPTLWFLRDLFIIYVLSPILLFIVRRNILNKVVFVLLSLFWITCVNCHIEALFFVYLGLNIVFNYNQLITAPISKIAYMVCLSLFSLLVVLKVAYMSVICTDPDIVNVVLLKLMILAGIPSLYYCVMNFVNKSGRAPSITHMLSKYSFFIYLFHLLVLTIVRKVLLMMFGLSPFIAYLGTVVITILLCILGYEILNSFFPRLLSVILGQRNNN